VNEEALAHWGLSRQINLKKGQDTNYHHSQDFLSILKAMLCVSHAQSFALELTSAIHKHSPASLEFSLLSLRGDLLLPEFINNCVSGGRFQ